MSIFQVQRIVHIELPIDSEYLLKRTMASLGSPYFSPETIRYFKSRVLDVSPTPNGAIFLESVKGPFGGRNYQVKQLVLLPNDHEISDVYSDRTVFGPTSKRAATKAYTLAVKAAQGPK